MRDDSGLGFFAPITYNRGEKGYYYTDPAYSIDNIPLKKAEVQALHNALALLLEYKGTGIFGEVEEAVEKLVSKVKIGMMKQESGLDAIVELERGNSNTGLQWLGVLVKAITEKTVVAVRYKKFNADESKEHMLHPCFLKEYRNRWYVIGWHQKHKSFSVFALDRITEVTPVPNVYEPPPFNPAQYFKNVIGMTGSEEKPQEVVLKVNKTELPYLLSQPVHPSLKLVNQHEDFGTVALKVVINFELRNFILGLQPFVEVLKPTTLRNEIAALLKQAAANYN